MTESTALPQKIVDRRIIFLKSRLDPTMARLLGEKVKGKFFTRLRFLKRKAEEIRLVSIFKYYEPYLVVSGKYAIDYCKKHVYSVNVDKNAREVAFFDRKFKPDPLSPPPDGAQVIKLDGVEFFHHEDEASFVLDKMGCELDPEQLPCAPSEKLTVEELTKTGMKLEEVKISLEEEIEFLRSRIVNRPSDVGEVIREIFELSERTLIYCPIYQLTYRNVKMGKEAIVKIDGTTSKTSLCKSHEAISHKSMKDSIEAPNGLEEISENIRNKTINLPKVTRVPEIEGKMKFPTKVAKGVVRVGEKATAIEGDVEIPSGTTVLKTLEVKGHLRIGTDCRILGKVKAVRDVIIGANATIDGDVISGGKVVIGQDSVINGSVESAEHVEIGENAVIRGGLHSKSSVALNSFARVYAQE